MVLLTRFCKGIAINPLVFIINANSLPFTGYNASLKVWTMGLHSLLGALSCFRMLAIALRKEQLLHGRWLAFAQKALKT